MQRAPESHSSDPALVTAQSHPTAADKREPGQQQMDLRMHREPTKSRIYPRGAAVPLPVYELQDEHSFLYRHTAQGASWC